MSLIRWNRKVTLFFPCCRYFCQPPIDIDNDDDETTLGLDYTVPPLSANARNILCGHQMMSQDRSCPQKVTTWEDCLELGVNSSIVGPSCPHTLDSPLCLPSSPSKPSKCRSDRSLLVDVEQCPFIFQILRSGRSPKHLWFLLQVEFCWSWWSPWLVVVWSLGLTVGPPATSVVWSSSLFPPWLTTSKWRSSLAETTQPSQLPKQDDPTKARKDGRRYVSGDLRRRSGPRNNRQIQISAIFLLHLQPTMFFLSFPNFISSVWAHFRGSQ